MSLNLMHFVQQLFGGQPAGHAAAQAHPQLAQHLQYMQPIAPHPNPGNGQVDPHSQAVYQQAMAHYQALVHPALQVMLQAPHHANLGVPFQYDHAGFPNVGQGGQFNPGAIPLQDVHPLHYQNSLQPTAQYHGLQIPQGGNFNPQDNPNQQYWSF